MCKNKKFTKSEILKYLDGSKYSNRYAIYPTFLDQNDHRWKRGYRSKFENSLLDDNLKHFAYIKFYIDTNKELVGLVAGKSGSKKVITRSDINFSTDPNDGEARQFLAKNNLHWCKTEILIVKTIATDEKENRKEAFKIETELKNWFNLKGK